MINVTIFYTFLSIDTHGTFHRWVYQNSWMVYFIAYFHRKSQQMDDLGVPYDSENLHILTAGRSCSGFSGLMGWRVKTTI